MQTKSEDGQVVLRWEQATELAKRVLARVGFGPEEASIVAAHLVDAELCGYPALGLARLLTIAEHPRVKEPRGQLQVIHETSVSALIDGSNNIGFYAAQRAAEISVEKARASGVAVVALRNSYMSGRCAYYLEMIARAGLVGIHLASGTPVVVPLGGKAPALGTNPIAVGLPSEPLPYIFDISTAALNSSDVALAGRLHRQLPEGSAVDAAGESTRDPAAARAGGILPFGGHKGFGLALTIQALTLLAGATSTINRGHDAAYLFIAFRPDLLMPLEVFRANLEGLLKRVRATPRQEGVDQIRIPSEVSFARRERRRAKGIPFDRNIYNRILAIGPSD